MEATSKNQNKHQNYEKIYFEEKVGGAWPFSRSKPAPQLTIGKEAVVQLDSRAPNSKFGSQQYYSKQTQAIDNAANATAALVVGQVITAGIASTGVGLPVAAVLAVVLLLASKLSLLVLNNLHLTGVLLDTMNITANCYLIFELIENENMIFALYFYYKQTQGKGLTPDLLTAIAEKGLGVEPNPATGETGSGLKRLMYYKNNPQLAPIQQQGEGNTPASTASGILGAITSRISGVTGSETPIDFRSVQLNPDIMARVTDKLFVVTKSLLEVTPNETVTILAKDQTIPTYSPLYALIQKEYKQRKLDVVGQGSRYERFSNSVSRKTGRITRGIMRTFNSAYIQSIIIKELTLLMGYFTLLKAQHDEAIQYYQRHYEKTDSEWPKLWEAIEAMPEYQTYLFPPSPGEVAKEATANSSSSERQLIEITKGVDKADIKEGEGGNSTVSQGGKAKNKKKYTRKIKKQRH